MFSLA